MRQILKEGVRYGAVVAIGLAVDIGLLYILTTHFEWWYFIASAFSFLIALTLNYVLTTRLVFQLSEHTRTLKSYSYFLGVGVSALCINQVIMYIGVEILVLSVLGAKIIALPITFLWNFFLNRFFVFRSNPTEHSLRE